VIDGVLDHSPAEHVRRSAVPPESPTLRFTHLQFEAMLIASRESANPSDFALVAMLGLLGLRIFEATSANVDDLGEEHGHRVLRVCGKGTKVVLISLPPCLRVGAACQATWLAARPPNSAPSTRHCAWSQMWSHSSASGTVQRGRPTISPHVTDGGGLR
jgi:integrase